MPGSSVKAVIMAGGRGSRFKPYTDLVPKPMLPVGPGEKPLLHVIIDWLRRHGVERILLLVGHRWRYIYNYFGDGSRLGVRVEYSVDDEEYGGTGGAMLKAYRAGLLDTDPVLVWYGDILAPLDPGSLLDTHRSSEAAATLAVAERYRVPVGVAELSGDGFVSGMREKPWLPLHVTIGVAALSPRVVGEAGGELGSRFDLMADLVPWMLSKGYRVKAYVYRGWWHDLGSLERYVKLDHRRLGDMLGGER